MCLLSARSVAGCTGENKVEHTEVMNLRGKNREAGREDQAGCAGRHEKGVVKEEGKGGI